MPGSWQRTARSSSGWLHCRSHRDRRPAYRELVCREAVRRGGGTRGGVGGAGRIGGARAAGQRRDETLHVGRQSGPGAGARTRRRTAARVGIRSRAGAVRAARVRLGLQRGHESLHEVLESCRDAGRRRGAGRGRGGPAGAQRYRSRTCWRPPLSSRPPSLPSLRTWRRSRPAR